jgi:hypothetical protein
MKKITKILYLLVLIFNQNFLFSNILESDVFVENNTNSSCMIYQPYLGVVKDAESLDIKSDKFEITDEKVLILNDNVRIDFPEGILNAGKARIDH